MDSRVFMVRMLRRVLCDQGLTTEFQYPSSLSQLAEFSVNFFVWPLGKVDEHLDRVLELYDFHILGGFSRLLCQL